MASIHTVKGFKKAQSMGAMAAHSWERWDYLTSMSKRELAELLVHLASLATESYDETIANDKLLRARIEEEREALRAQGTL